MVLENGLFVGGRLKEIEEFFIIVGTERGGSFYSNDRVMCLQA